MLEFRYITEQDKEDLKSSSTRRIEGMWSHIRLIGEGNSKAEAALNFVEAMQHFFPNGDELYETVIRSPLQYELATDFNTSKQMHGFYMRISFRYKEK